MTHYPGMPRRYSAEWFSDANLEAVGEAASYADFAPLPGERVSDAMKASPSMQAWQRHGGAVTPLPLADIEVDSGSTSADFAPEMLTDPQPRYAAPAAQGGVDESSLDRLADLLVERITKRLGG